MNRLRSGLLVLAMMLSGASTVSVSAQEAAGKQLYLKYCSACHGSEGKGDGVVSQLMTPKPNDLTQIAKLNKGEFPTLEVMKVIDGRETMRAHGDPEMPVWGDVLKSQVGDGMAGEQNTKGTIMQISEYLRSIQVK